MAGKIKATLIRSPIGRCRQHRETVARLGFKRLHQTITKEDRPEILGMIRKVHYMLRVEHISEESSLSKEPKTKPKRKPAPKKKVPVQSTEKEEDADA